MKKVGLWIYDYFCNIFGVNKFWHVPLCKRVVIEFIWTVFNMVLHVFIGMWINGLGVVNFYS